LIPSHFQNAQTTIFYYPSGAQSDSVVLILKGLYGEHVSDLTEDNASWDNTLVFLLIKNHHVIFVRSGRLESESKMEKFEGKTFQDECEDIQDAIDYAKEHIVPKESTWSCVGNSFGGTTLLGMPSQLLMLENIIFINSGCGRNPTTTKPLVSTLPETSKLLEPLRSYKGNFIFLNGCKDTVVPLDSKKKIFESLCVARNSKWIDFSELDHELVDQKTKESKLAAIVSEILLK
jgi:hypothetical protein